MPDSKVDELSFPIDPIPGAITMVLRENRIREIGMLSIKKERHTFRVRAIITDNPPANRSIYEIVGEAPNVRIELLEQRLSIFDHYGNDKAVFFDLVRGPEGHLSHIEVHVSACLPQLALGYARAAVDRLLDRFSGSWTNPHHLSILRLELLSPQDGEIIAYQVMLPFAAASSIGRFGGFMPTGLFAGHYAMLREAVNNPSPFYRLLLAYRAHEGLASLRERIAKARRHYKIAEPMPKEKLLNEVELARLQLSLEVRKLKRLSQLFRHFGYLRNGIAHFLLEPGPSAEGHIYLSSIMVYTYALASAVLLKYLRDEIRSLEGYYQQHIRPHLDLGRLVLPQEQYRERFIVFAPDSESEVYEDQI